MRFSTAILVGVLCALTGLASVADDPCGQERDLAGITDSVQQAIDNSSSDRLNADSEAGQTFYGIRDEAHWLINANKQKVDRDEQLEQRDTILETIQRRLRDAYGGTPTEQVDEFYQQHMKYAEKLEGEERRIGEDEAFANAVGFALAYGEIRARGGPNTFDLTKDSVVCYECQDATKRHLDAVHQNLLTRFAGNGQVFAYGHTQEKAFGYSLWGSIHDYGTIRTVKDGKPFVVVDFWKDSSLPNGWKVAGK